MVSFAQALSCARYACTHLHQRVRDTHLGRATARQQSRLEDDILGHGHGVLKVSVNLRQHVLGGTSQQNGARRRILALLDERKVLVANLADLEQAALANVAVLDLVRAADDRGAGGSGNAVVVGLAQTTKGRHVGAHQIMLREVYEQQVRRFVSSRLSRSHLARSLARTTYPRGPSL